MKAVRTIEPYERKRLIEMFIDEQEMPDAFMDEVELTAAQARELSELVFYDTDLSMTCDLIFRYGIATAYKHLKK